MSILPDAETFRQLADGSLRGLGPTLLRGGLATLAVPYAVASAARNLLYDNGLVRQWSVDAPVISIGNLTLGGTGKTPLVAWVARELLAQDRRPAVVSRGYAARPAHLSDEAAELAIVLPGVPHVANRDRVAAAARAAELGADVVVLDDGFQHRRLRRDVDILAIDATDPFGCDHLIPRGLLRESLAGLRRAEAVVLTRADRIDAPRRDAIRTAVNRARRGRPPVVWLDTRHAAVAVRGSDGSVAPLASLAGRRVAAFCGIGNPAAFRHTLTEVGAEVVGFRSFADHHHYTPADIGSLATWAEGVGAEQTVTTLKDLVRLGTHQPLRLRVVAVEIAVESLDDPTALRRLLAATNEQRRSRPT
jgi:tetraacyldisaccharide 4'-kinase